MKISRISLGHKLFFNKSSLSDFKFQVSNFNQIRFFTQDIETLHFIDNLILKQKEFETATLPHPSVELSKPLILRLDGHNFSSFSKNFEKPYDTRISDSMLQTSVDIFEDYPAVSIYIASDEISVLFAPSSKNGVISIPYSGRIQKIVSLSAGFVSARFNYHIAKKIQPDTNPELKAKMSSGRCYFDSRVISFPTIEDCWTYILYRYHNTRRNSVSMLARKYFKQRVIENLKRTELINLLKDHVPSIDYESFPEFYKYGVLLKKRKVLKQGFDKIKKEEVSVYRSEIGVLSVHSLIPKPVQYTSSLLFCKAITENEFPDEFKLSKPAKEDNREY